MKNMKKMTAFVLSAVMAAGMTVSVSAAVESKEDYARQDHWSTAWNNR